MRSSGNVGPAINVADPVNTCQFLTNVLALTEDLDLEENAELK
jgi:hypothetical protein